MKEFKKWIPLIVHGLIAVALVFLAMGFAFFSTMTSRPSVPNFMCFVGGISSFCIGFGLLLGLGLKLWDVLVAWSKE